MKLNTTKLNTLLAETGRTPEDLASALPRAQGSQKKLDEATKAVRNWLRGAEHPRCTASDAAAMAGVLGVQVRDIARFQTQARWVRSSPQKARLLAELIRGKRVDEADMLLEFNCRRASKMVRKALRTAIADAEQADARVERLVVTEARVDQGVIIKRFQPKDRGRAHRIQKKTSHITIGVEEIA
ncbi:MAG: 50S ribosomal protein L22 [Planctomycetota bacterium]